MVEEVVVVYKKGKLDSQPMARSCMANQTSQTLSRQFFEEADMVYDYLRIIKLLFFF